MKNSKIANFVFALVILTLGASSCDILFDPYDPGHGGGGRDTIIWEDPCDSIIVDDPSDSNWHRDTINNDDGDTDVYFVQSQGTVLWIPIEGGFWGIESIDGHDYEVLNLPRKFQHHGMRVAFSGRVHPEAASMYMWGEVLEIHKIERLP